LSHNLQSKKTGLIEAATNSIGGYPIGLIIGIIILPMSAGWIQKDPIIANLAITSVYVCVSFIRSYFLGRAFKKINYDGDIMGLYLVFIKKLESLVQNKKVLRLLMIKNIKWKVPSQ